MQITPKNPIYLTEISYHPMIAFSFTLPSQDFGWEGIAIFVEYGQTDSRPDRIGYNVWVQFPGAVFRGFVCSGDIPGKIEDEETIQRIVWEINISDTFHEELLKYINCQPD